MWYIKAAGTKKVTYSIRKKLQGVISVKVLIHLILKCKFYKIGKEKGCNTGAKNHHSKIHSERAMLFQNISSVLGKSYDSVVLIIKALFTLE